MKNISKIFTAIIFLFWGNALDLLSQVEWFEKGQVYSYEVTTSFDIENYGIHTMTYVKDTVINGHILKKLGYTDRRGHVSYIFTQQTGEKIRHYKPFLDQFKLMYDFTAQAGDPSPVSGYIIERTGSIEIENTIRKTQTWRNGNKRVFVIEGIGMVGDPDFTSLYVCSPPVPFYGCTGYVDGFDYYFRCFKSEDIHFDPYGKCATANTNEDTIYSTLFPNPTTHDFTIKSSKMFDVYRIYDQTGKMMYEQSISPNVEAECHFEASPSLYFIQMYNQNKLIGTEKLVVLPSL